MGSLTRTTLKIFAGPNKKVPKRVISFQQYLNRAYKAAKDADELGPTDLGLRASIPISIYLRSKGPNHVYAGVFDEIGGVGRHLDLEEYFSGSLPKVAAMFAAFKLRKAARLLIKDIQDHKETASVLPHRVIRRVQLQLERFLMPAQLPWPHFRIGSVCPVEIERLQRNGVKVL